MKRRLNTIFLMIGIATAGTGIAATADDLSPSNRRVLDRAISRAAESQRSGTWVIWRGSGGFHGLISPGPAYSQSTRDVCTGCSDPCRTVSYTIESGAGVARYTSDRCRMIEVSDDGFPNAMWPVNGTDRLLGFRPVQLTQDSTQTDTHGRNIDRTTPGIKWRNQDNPDRGKFESMNSYRDNEGQSCRRVRETFLKNGIPQAIESVWCRDDRGKWVRIESTPSTTPHARDEGEHGSTKYSSEGGTALPREPGQFANKDITLIPPPIRNLPPSSPEKAGEAVALARQIKQIQEGLKALLYYKGSSDGDFGPSTKKSVLSFLADENASLPSAPSASLLKLVEEAVARVHAGICPSSKDGAGSHLPYVACATIAR